MGNNFIDIVFNEDCLCGMRKIPSNSIDCCVTSPPYYGLRDYGETGQIGRESTYQQYIQKLCKVFNEVYRILKQNGTLWLNIGDSYQNKNLIGIPWLLAFELQKNGWNLRQDIIWHKKNAMPESVKDRCVRSHEYIFLMSKSEKYYFDIQSIQEKAVIQDVKHGSKFGGKKYGSNKDEQFQIYSGKEYVPTIGRDGCFVRNKRDVWSVNVEHSNISHFATFPEKLIKPCILAGCQRDGVVLDPFMGSGTTARVARSLNRHFTGFEINKEYYKIIEKQIQVSRDLFY